MYKIHTNLWWYSYAKFLSRTEKMPNSMIKEHILTLKSLEKQVVIMKQNKG